MTSNNLLNYHKPRKVPLGSSRGVDSDEAREGEDWARGRRMAVAGAETATLHVTQPRDTEPRDSHELPRATSELPGVDTNTRVVTVLHSLPVTRGLDMDLKLGPRSVHTQVNTD